ncbi:MAG: AAA family ATPase [Thiolinea sp.]
MILTILHQPNPPSLICIEDIDYGLHPRLFQKIVELCFDIAHGEQGIQILATTHNPYIIDLFKDHEEAVLLVEKRDAYTQFSTLAERLEHLDVGENPLGELWFSGALNDHLA